MSKPRRRITPIALAPTPPTPALAPAPAPAPVSAAPVAAAPAPVAAPQSVPLLNDRIRTVLTELRDDLDAMLTSPFAPQTRDVDGLDANVRALRAAIQRAEADAAAAKRTAEAERARLARELKPVRIERTAATAQIYSKNKSVLANEKRYLYMCALADPSTGICKPTGARRAFRPAARRNVQFHIDRWHLGKDALREQRRSDDWWAEGAAETRARAHAVHNA